MRLQLVRPGHSARSVGIAAVALLILGMVAVRFDFAVFELVRSTDFHAEFVRLLFRAETFGHFYGLAAIVAVLASVHPEHWRRYARVFLAAVSAGLIADLVKVFIIRARPDYVVDTLEKTGKLADSAPMLNTRAVFDSHWQSFPSAHSAIAVALALALSVCFPRGRFAFITIAVLCMMQRVILSKHYLGDVLIGGSIACFATLFWYHSKFARTTLTEWEAGGDAASETITFRRAA